MQLVLLSSISCWLSWETQLPGALEPPAGQVAPVPTGASGAAKQVGSSREMEAQS